MARSAYVPLSTTPRPFRIQASRDMGKTWENCCQTLETGKAAMLCVDYYNRTSRHFRWRYLDTITGTPAGMSAALL